jgi:septum formation protein
MEIILASTSPYRKELLKKLSLEFIAVAPEVDEEEFKQGNLNPMQLATTLATAKAQSVSQKFPHALIIGSDQVVEKDNKIYSKPQTFEKAAAQLAELSGQIHRIITAVSLIYNQKIVNFCDVTILHMRQLHPEIIKNYLRNDIPFDCAGSYKLESKGISLFHKIESMDFTAVTGLPLIALGNHLRDLGLQVPGNNWEAK